MQNTFEKCRHVLLTKNRQLQQHAGQRRRQDGRGTARGASARPRGRGAGRTDAGQHVGPACGHGAETQSGWTQDSQCLCWRWTHSRATHVHTLTYSDTGGEGLTARQTPPLHSQNEGPIKANHRTQGGALLVFFIFLKSHDFNLS